MAVITKTKPKISPAEMERRRGALRYAISHNRMERQFLDPEGAALFDAFVRGEIEKPELRERLRALNCQS
jgi:hypothetical protein